MNLRRLLPHAAMTLLGLAAALPSCASTMSGSFTADNDVFQYEFNTTTAQQYTFTTTSYATGGFVPVLTLFSSTGTTIDNSGTGTSDASIVDGLSPGSYILTLTEFPNVAVGSFADGFLFAGDPTATGDVCNVPGGMFYDAITCTQRTANYEVNSTIAPTPEPSSWLLMASGVAVLAYTSRRRLFA